MKHISVNAVVEWDADTDACYLAFSPKDRRAQVARTIPIMDRESRIYGAIDLSTDDELVGIELLGAARILGRVLAQDEAGEHKSP